jgi:hypothetical protein
MRQLLQHLRITHKEAKASRFEKGVSIHTPCRKPLMFSDDKLLMMNFYWREAQAGDQAAMVEDQ